MAKPDKSKKPAPKPAVKAAAKPAAKPAAAAATSKKGSDSGKASKTIKIRGRAVYPRLNEPDTKFKDEGEYSSFIALPEDRAAKLIRALEQKLKDDYEPMCQREKKSKLKMASTRPWKPETDRETDEETGYTLFKVATKASGKSRKTGKQWEFKLPLIDSKLKPVRKPVWGGSEIIADVEPYTWYTAALGYGISLRLNGVQVIDLVTGSGKNPADMFSEEEGYEEDEDEEENEDTSSDDDDNSDDGEDEDEDGGEDGEDGDEDY